MRNHRFQFERDKERDYGSLRERDDGMGVWETMRVWDSEREDEAYENWYQLYLFSFFLKSPFWSCFFVYFSYFYVFGGERQNISKYTYLPTFLTEVGNRDQTELNTSEQSVKF